MHNFKPKAASGTSVAPEAHREWNDKEGKHSSMQLKGEGVVGKTASKIGVSRDSFNPGKGIKQHEAAQKMKSHGNGNGSAPFAKVTSGRGPKSGPAKC